MSVLRRRIASVEEQVRERQPTPVEEPATVRWLRVLRIFLPALEKAEQTADVAAAFERVRWSVALIEEFLASDLAAHPCPYLEYYCNACVLRLSWNSPDWHGRQLAFMEADYEDHMRQIEQIERCQRGSS